MDESRLQDQDKGRKSRGWLIALIVLVVGLICLLPCLCGPIWIACGLWSNAHPDLGENAKSVSWLPKEATNISYYKTYSYTAYEFDISGTGFRNWASQWPLKPIDSLQKIERYSFLQHGKLDTCAEIEHGLYHYMAWEDGGRMHVVYDSDHKRAYFQCNPR